MKLAVTGCNGSVGLRVVVAALKQGHNVVIGIDEVPIMDVLTQLTDRASAEGLATLLFHRADLREYAAALKLLEGCKGVVQLAGMPTPGNYVATVHNTNVVISWNALRAAAELGINRVAQASSVDVIPLVWTDLKDFEYFPHDEDHPTRPDEPYGLSKVICEHQADTIVRRYPSMRIASLRLSWSIPNREAAFRKDPGVRKNDLWGYVQEDSAADAFLLAVADENGRWSGHERFFITAPDAASDVPPKELWERYWPDVPIKEGKELSGAQRLLGWVHRRPGK